MSEKPGKAWISAGLKSATIGTMKDGVFEAVPQRYTWVIMEPQLIIENGQSRMYGSRIILASKGDADRFLNHETVPVVWQVFENGAWSDGIETHFKFERYKPGEACAPASGCWRWVKVYRIVRGWRNDENQTTVRL